MKTNTKGTRSKRLSSADCRKHTVSIENEQWNKLERFANENNVTISYILNELIRSVDNFENRPRFGMIKNEGDNS